MGVEEATRFTTMPSSPLLTNRKPAMNTNSENNSHKVLQRSQSHVSEKVIAKGKWLTLSKYTYTDHAGNERVWEVAGRCKKQEDKNSADCVSTLAVLRRTLMYDCLVLVKQYRPPLKAYTLELPAGLVDFSESIEDTARRELKEETGYCSSVVKHVSPMTALDPGLSNCTMKILSMQIDGDHPANLTPSQHLKDDEDIEVVHVPVDELLTRLNEYSEQGIMIDSRVYTFAIGLAVGTKLAHP